MNNVSNSARIYKGLNLRRGKHFLFSLKFQVRKTESPFLHFEVFQRPNFHIFQHFNKMVRRRGQQSRAFFGYKDQTPQCHPRTTIFFEKIPFPKLRNRKNGHRYWMKFTSQGKSRFSDTCVLLTRRPWHFIALIFQKYKHS